jgi:hypothetical protein
MANKKGEVLIGVDVKPEIRQAFKIKIAEEGRNAKFVMTRLIEMYIDGDLNVERKKDGRED